MPFKNKDDKLKYQRVWYKKNKDKQIRWSDNYKRKQRKWFADLKKTKKCEICGESHPACLVYHHKDSSKKKYDITYMIRAGFAKDKILAEIAKCQVLCANCHRKIHYEELQKKK